MSQPTKYSVKISVPVAWGEMDAFGHVNNIMYFRYFESARIEYFDYANVMDDMKEGGVGPILAQTSCRYKKPVTYPDNLTVQVRVKSMGTSSFVMEQSIVSEKWGEEVAIGDAVIVMINYNTGKKTPIPHEVRQRIAALEQLNF